MTRKYLFFVGLLCAFSFLTLGFYPGSITVGDFDNDGDIDGADIKLAMQSCGRGFTTGKGGCHIQLEDRTYSITTSLLWGDGAGNSDFQNGITIEGVGACTLGTSPPYIGGGTVLKWDGADLGTVIRIDRAHRGALKKLCIVMDPDLVASTGSEARNGILFDGDNGTATKTTQGFVLEDVSIWGSISGTPPASSAAVYITGAGAPKSAQNDKMVFERFWTDGLDVALKQDALQALVNTCRSCQLFGYSNALYLSGGDWKLSETIAGARNLTTGIVYNLAYQTNSGGTLTLEDSYYESGALTGGTFLRIGQGYSATNSTYGGYDVILRGGYALNQCFPGCNLTFVDGAVRHLIVDGFLLNVQGTGNTWGVRASNFNGSANQVATVRWEPRYFPWNPSTIFTPVNITSGVRFYAPVVGAGSALVWNDVNTPLNHTLDAGEAAW